MSQNSDNSDLSRLRQLAAEKCNGTLTPTGLEELTGLLARSPEAREEYWEILILHANLDWELAGEAGYCDELARIVLEDSTWRSDASKVARTPQLSTWGFALAICLFVGAMVGIWPLWRAEKRQPVVGLPPVDQRFEQSPILGHLKPVVPDSRWSFGRLDNPDSNAFHRGETIWLDRGAAELRLTTDTVALMEAPVILQIVSLDRFRVLRGCIKVEVPKGAEGFTVETASAEVVDLGTVFSVEVNDQNTDIVVFQGEVNLKVNDQRELGRPTLDALSRRFRTGQAVRVSGDGTLSRIVNVCQSRISPTGDQSTGTAVITSVRDNISRDDLWSYYEIVVGGMGEDSRAFVDRRHEWNGSTDDGIPPYLLGGDYVKTFNDDKVADDLIVNVTLARPANLYVLLDKRVTPPDWLVESFTDTGDEIGVDEAFHDPLDYEPGLEDFAESGPGKSIERTHSIWKLVVADSGVVPLGPNGRLPGENSRGIRAGANMYGIVAVPIDRADPYRNEL